MNISVVVPLYNEEESLPELISWIQRVMKEHAFTYEVILVNDGSTDHSWKVVKELHTAHPETVRGISFRRNYGKSAALNVGFEASQGDVVITMDADLQDSPDEIPDLYKMITEDGHDLVSGYKQKRYDPFMKTFPTKIFNGATRYFSGIHNLHDFNCGLKAYKSKVVKSIEIYGEMHRQIPVIAKAAGFDNIAEKVVQHQARKYGVTKFGADRFINGLLDLLTITFLTRYQKRPMHFFGFWGILFSVIGGSTLGYLVLVKIAGVLRITESLGSLSERMPALFFGTVCFLLGILLLTTGLLAELISRTSSNRNEYHVEERL